ncbi:hypothetical protein JB92DRAFT_2905696, partial [Gautieria morchelliformis]
MAVYATFFCSILMSLCFAANWGRSFSICSVRLQVMASVSAATSSGLFSGTGGIIVASYADSHAVISACNSESTSVGQLRLFTTSNNIFSRSSLHHRAILEQ